MAWCYENGYSCYNGPRDYENFDYTNYSTYSKSGVLNAKASCEANGGIFYLGKHLKEGKFDSASKYAGAYCNVAGPRYCLGGDVLEHRRSMQKLSRMQRVSSAVLGRS